MTEPEAGGCIEDEAVGIASQLRCPLHRQCSGDDGRDSVALGKGTVVDESMSGRLLDLDRRKIRVGREEETT